MKQQIGLAIIILSALLGMGGCACLMSYADKIEAEAKVMRGKS